MRKDSVKGFAFLVYSAIKNLNCRVKTLFADFGGEDIFSLDRETLIKHCGEEEGKHLYSLLLVQKSRSNVRFKHKTRHLKELQYYSLIAFQSLIRH